MQAPCRTHQNQGLLSYSGRLPRGDDGRPSLCRTIRRVRKLQFP